MALQRWEPGKEKYSAVLFGVFVKKKENLRLLLKNVIMI